MEWELKKKLLFILIGIQVGVPWTYYSIFKFTGGGMLALVLNIVAGNLISILLIGKIAKIEQNFNDARKLIALAFIGYIIADVVLVVGVVEKNVWLIILNNVIAAPFGLIFWKNVDYYPIAVEGFTNRAKIVNQRVFWTSVGAAAGVLLFSVIPVTIYTTFVATVIARVLVMIVLATSPYAPVEDSHPSVLRGHVLWEHVTVIVVLFLIAYANQLYNGSFSVYQKIYFGDFSVPFISAAMFLVFGFTQHSLMRYFTSDGDFGLKALFVLLPIVGVFVAGFSLPYVVFGRAILSALFLSARHSVIKTLPSEKTGAVIMGTQVINNLSTLFMVPFALFGTPELMFASSVVVALIASGLILWSSR